MSIVQYEGYGLNPAAYALSSLLQNSYYASAANQALAPTFSFGVLFRMLAVSGTTRYLFANENTGGSGLRCLVTAAERLQWRCYNSAGVGADSSPTTVFTASTAIKGAVMMYDGTTIRSCVNKGTLVSTTPATGGFTAAVSRKFSVGNNALGGGTGAEATDLEILGVRYSNAVQTQGQCDSWFDACKAAVDCVPLIAGTANGWRVKCEMSDLNAKPQWDPADGAFSLLLFGTSVCRRPTVSMSLAPTWDW